MRTILFLFFLCCFSIAKSATYYISPSGNDTTGTGSSISPWRSLYKACNTATTAGDIIYVNAGRYLANQTCNLAVGVSITGAGATSVILTTNDADDFIILSLVSASEGTNGNQSISYIKLDGNKVSDDWGIGDWGITINRRSNVHIHHCTIVDFKKRGICFRGSATSGQATVYSTGNKVYNCTIDNCAHMFTGTGTGCLLIGSQENMDIYNNTITQNSRDDQLNGFPIKYQDGGYNRDIRIFNNTLTAALQSEPYSTFSIELWESRGGIQIYDNILKGALDIASATKEGYDYSVDIHHNTFGYDSEQPSWERGIIIEGDIEDLIIRQNLFKYLSTGIQINHGINSDRTNNLYIYYNVMQELSTAYGNDQTWGIRVTEYDDGQVSYGYYVYNNTIKASTTSSYLSMYGIHLPRVGEFHGAFIRNNIVVGFDRGPINGYIDNGATYSFDTLVITNNIFYQNGNSNDPVYENSFSATNYVITDNQKVNPLLTSVSDYNLNLNSTAIDEGFQLGYTEDFAGDYVPFNLVPDIGAYEYSYIRKLLKNAGSIVKYRGKVIKY